MTPNLLVNFNLQKSILLKEQANLKNWDRNTPFMETVTFFHFFSLYVMKKTKQTLSKSTHENHTRFA